MDKSRRYITLSERAEEIQQRWVPSYGDFFMDANGRITCWLTGAEGRMRVKKGFAVCPEGSLIRLTRYIWLPRQDQLIEMAQVRGRTYDHVVLDFYNWTKADYTSATGPPSKLFPSMEQVWLAYVMQRKFFKQWRDSAWHSIR